MAERLTKDVKLTRQDINDIINQGVKFLKTRDSETGIDILSKVREFIKEDSGIILSDGVKIGVKNLEHVMDCHGYDTELGIGISVKMVDFLKIPEILDTFDSIENSDVKDSFGKVTHIRYLLKKSYGLNTYNLIIEIQNNRKVDNQIGMITLYINDIFTEPEYLKAKATGQIDKMREKAIKDYGKIVLEFID